MEDIKSHKKCNSIFQIARPILQDIYLKKTGFDPLLLKYWEDIVGSDFAQTCHPFRIYWVSKSEKDNHPDKGATLVIACHGLSVLHLPHMKKQIIDRMNVFLGYHAISQLKFKKIEHSVNSTSSIVRNLTCDEEYVLQEKVSKIDNPALRDALKELGKKILTKA